MTNSRVERRQLLVAIVFASLFCGGMAWAQSPVDLRKPPGFQDSPSESPGVVPPSVSTETPTAAPRRLTPGQTTMPAETAPQPKDTAPVDARSMSGIQVNDLSAIDSESVGVLNPQDGGYGAEMWRDVTRSEAVDLVRALPTRPGSAALRDVAVRLLLSRAKAPYEASEGVPSLLAARAQALLSMGEVDGAEALLSAAPKQDRPAGLDAVDAMLQVLKFDNARACGLARNNQADAASDFWQRLLVYCDALDGKAESVAFGVSLLRESSGDDPAMALLADAIQSGTQVIIENVANPKPIHLAMSRAAKVALPPSIAESEDPLVLYGVALAPNLPLGTRIEAAERAVAVGTLAPVVLRQLYTEVKYTDADLSNALTRAGEIGGAAARALLYQAATKQNIPVARAEIISSAIDVAREDGRYLPAVRAFRPLIDRLPPSPEMVWFALTGVRAYLILGDPVGTDRWLALLRASASIRDESKLALDRVRPLASLLGVGARSATLREMLDDWRKSIASRPELLATVPLMNGMFMALGETLPANAWDAVVKTAPQRQMLPDAGVWFRFRDSVRGLSQATPPSTFGAANLTRLTQTATRLPAADLIDGIAKPVLLALQAMGDGGPDARSVILVFEVVSALKTMGLEEAARRLAVETVLAAGL